MPSTYDAFFANSTVPANRGPGNLSPFQQLIGMHARSSGASPANRPAMAPLMPNGMPQWAGNRSVMPSPMNQRIAPATTTPVFRPTMPYPGPGVGAQPMARPAPGPVPPLNKPVTVTTYAARLRDGSTSLMVPQEWTSTRGPGGSSSSRRRRRRFQDDSDLDDEGTSDDNQPEATVAKATIKLGQHPTIVDGQVVSRIMRSSNHIYVDDAALLDLAKGPEALVPIRLDLDLEHYKLHDNFLWNVHEKFLTPEKFAQMLCLDLDVANPSNVEAIAQAIRSQLDDYRTFYDIQSFRHRDLEAMNSHEATSAAGQFFVDPVRVAITLDLQVGRQLLRDQFEWDLSTSLDDENMMAMPEAFARTLTAELGLGGEFVSLIAYSIRDQLVRHQRERMDHEVESAGTPSLTRPDAIALRDPQGTYSVNRDRLTGDHVDPELVRVGQLPSHGPDAVFRPTLEGGAWAPHIEHLTQDELEKILIDKERAIRRLRRETSRLLQSARQRRSSPYPTALGYSASHLSEISSPSPATSTAHGPMASSGSPSRLSRSGSQLTQPFSQLSQEEKRQWQCTHCGIDGTQTTLVRKGPQGPKSLCNACGIAWAARDHLPAHRRNMFNKGS